MKTGKSNNMSGYVPAREIFMLLSIPVAEIISAA